MGERIQNTGWVLPGADGDIQVLPFILNETSIGFCHLCDTGTLCYQELERGPFGVCL